jgi:C-terminal processing protease CtpA/Prc
MRSGLLAGVLGVALAGPAAAGQVVAARIWVQGAGGGVNGIADSVEDVKRELAELNPALPVALARSREEADLVLEITSRHTEERMNNNLTPPVEWTYSILDATLFDADRPVPLQAETEALIKTWRTAASTLVMNVRGYVERNHHTLLRRRADWPALGIEFEELTKERKKQFGLKDGKVVVTAVAPGGAGERGGLRAGDVISTVDGEKVKGPVQLARALYAGGSKPFSLGVVQAGAARTVSLALQ